MTNLADNPDRDGTRDGRGRRPMPMRMRTALLAFEAWAEAVIPMLENAGADEAAAFGRDRIEQSENARTTWKRAKR